ncbi:MAG TPA: AsmA family protein [Terracidiphilus sp.]|jgi:AsmA protein
MQANRANLDLWRARSREMLQIRWVRITAGVAALVLVTLIAVPFFVNADTFRPTVENELSSALGRKVTLGHLSLSLFSGSLVAENVAIADDPSFGSSPFFQAKSLHIGVAIAALLFRRQVRVTRFTADSPQIHLIPGPNGTWNYSNLGHSGSSQASSQASSAPDLSVGELKIRNGSVDVSALPSSGRPFACTHVDLTVQHLSLGAQMPFQLTADLPGNGSLKLSGTAGPVAQQNAVNTPLQASIEVKHFNPVDAGVVTPSEGVSMVADVNAQLASDGKTLTMTGKMEAAQLKLSANGSPAPQPVDVDLTVTDNLGTRAGQVTDVAIHSGSVAAHIAGTYQMTGQTVLLNLRLSAPGLPVDGLEQLLPSIGVKLPPGSSLHGGTLTANLAITGAVAAPQIAGPIEIDNTQLAGFDLGSRIEGLASLAAVKNTSGATTIRTLRTNVVSTPQSTQLNNIDGDVPSLGTATGSGTVSASGALNFQLVAKLSSSGSVGGAMTGAMSSVGGIAGNFLHTAAANGIPLSITGTTSSPSIRANVGAMVKQQTGGLLGKSTGGQGGQGGLSGLAKGILGK